MPEVYLVQLFLYFSVPNLGSSKSKDKPLLPPGKLNNEYLTVYIIYICLYNYAGNYSSL